MVLAFLVPSDAPNPDALFEEGLMIGAADADHNWTHAGIARLARNHGVHAYAQEFKSRSQGRANAYEERLREDGIRKIARSIDLGLPVVLSVTGRREGGPHTVLAIGFVGEVTDPAGLIVHDPDHETTEGGSNIHMSIVDLRKTWRNMAIFFEPIS
jgi:hypothetical protein